MNVTILLDSNGDVRPLLFRAYENLAECRTDTDRRCYAVETILSVAHDTSEVALLSALVGFRPELPADVLYQLLDYLLSMADEARDAELNSTNRAGFEMCRDQYDRALVRFVTAGA